MTIPFKDVTGQVRACKACGETKDLKTGFRHSKTFDCYAHICRECRSAKEKQNRSKYVKEKPNDIKVKKCKGCGEEKNIEEFSFHKATGYYLGFCKDCKNLERRAKYAGAGEEIKRERSWKRREQYGRSPEDKIRVAHHHCVTYDRRKGLECDVDLDYVREELKKPCVYCGFPSTGLDRIVNGLGHTKENCIPACRDCNIARSNHFSVEEMKIVGAAIRMVKLRRESDNKEVTREHRHKGE